MAYDNQKFLVNNLIHEGTTATVDSENAQYPLSNLLDDRRTKVFRSTANDTIIKFDFGTARPVDILMLVDSGLRSFGFLSATIQLNNTDSWIAPAYSQAVDIDFTHGFAVADFTSTQTFRYARLVLNNTAGYCEVSKLFLGQAVDLGEISFSYPVSFAANTNANITRNRLGQRFIDEVNTIKSISGQLQTLNKEELDGVYEIMDYCSITRPVWVYFPESLTTISNNNNRLSGYYYFKDDPDLSLSAGNFWNVAISLEEGT